MLVLYTLQKHNEQNLSLSKSDQPKPSKKLTISQAWRKSRSKYYSNTSVRRYVCPPNKFTWQTIFLEYQPRDYTSNTESYADPQTNLLLIPFNHFDDQKGINRRSHEGDCSMDNDIYPGESVPRNPFGRTGIIGRGALGLWGPTHAVDPIVTRWKTGLNDAKILEWIAIQRENGEWAIPGGMVRNWESRPDRK